MDRAHTQGNRQNDGLETGLWGAYGRENSVDKTDRSVKTFKTTRLLLEEALVK